MRASFGYVGGRGEVEVVGLGAIWSFGGIVMNAVQKTGHKDVVE